MRSHPSGDRGVVDVSIEMLVGLLMVVAVCLAVFEAVAYWHARNVFEDAASEGVRVAAAWDGSCDRGVEAAKQAIASRSASWAADVAVTCTDGPTVVVSISGRTPGVLGDAVGFEARVTETAPKER